ncbi:queuosine precursor transporter [Candidatus Falkowbacteria bacterium]|nr:queuosine precursor transporter [Candidatus Falkowbacteria bacterium]
MTIPKLNFKIIIALTLYLTSLFASNTLGLKLMPFLFGTHLSVAVFFFPFVFLTTDVIGQVYGKAMAKTFVWAGALSVILFFIYSLISLLAPWSPDGTWAHDSYNTIFGVSVRISIASVLAFIIGEYQDVLAFFFFKKKLQGRAFWLQSNLSNLISQLLDTAIFMFVAFLGVYSVKTIILISIPWWLYKVLMGLFYTPLSYLGIALLKDHSDENQTNPHADL